MLSAQKLIAKALAKQWASEGKRARGKRPAQPPPDPDALLRAVELEVRSAYVLADQSPPRRLLELIEDALQKRLAQPPAGRVTRPRARIAR